MRQQRFARHAGRHHPRHHVQARAAQAPRNIRGALDSVAEFGAAAGQGGHAALARRPVAGWRVEQHVGQAVIAEAPAISAGGCS
jgi:hypothetical protein